MSDDVLVLLVSEDLVLDTCVVGLAQSAEICREQSLGDGCGPTSVTSSTSLTSLTSLTYLTSFTAGIG